MINQPRLKQSVTKDLEYRIVGELYCYPAMICIQGVILLINLTPTQARVIGVLLEKEVTTPEQYPLSLNSLTNACNQKSNREPVMALGESLVQEALDELREKKLILEQSSSRVSKYKHRFCNTQFSDLQLSKQQVAILCVLLLRGAQTPGELRTRTQRLAEFANVGELETALESLFDINAEQLVIRHEREPGKREARYSQLFCPDNAMPSAGEPSQPAVDDMSNEHPLIETQYHNRIEALETEVAQLREQLSEIRQMLA